MKIIKIFLASSSELKSDREQFEILINRENKEYIKQGIFLELVIWEDFLDVMSPTRLQDEYNKAIANCDVFVSLFWTKVGQYTEEEFEKAFASFKVNNKPLIYTFFKDAGISPSQARQIQTVFDFQDKLSKLRHFYTNYADINDLKYKFSKQLNKLVPNLTPPFSDVAPTKTIIEPSGPVLKDFGFEVVTVNNRGEEVKRERGHAKYFTEELGNFVTLDMIAIPGGKFMMGSPKGEGFDREKPQHEVTVQTFFMGKYPVTQAQYQQIMGKNPSNFEGGNRPVEQVSWNDAVEFCQRLSKQTGKEYRLPTEAEWEYACRAGTITPFYFGETITKDLANYRGTDWEISGKVYPGNYANGPKGQYREKTTAVGIFPPNTFGLYDMHGQVWEWCQDDWHENYGGAPIDGRAWISGANNTKVLRDGSWVLNPNNCRSAVRNDLNPEVDLSTFGFRLVCSVPRT
ncbi:MAG: formylglycine-generating enzyme family protein [Cyanobacteria bacterium P01_F01_bin.143]